MSEELKLNENVGAPQPDALAQIASVDPSPAVGGVHRFTPTMLSRLKEQRQLLSVVDMAHRLNLPIIAEGVETPEQVSMLQAADCLYTQGYYFYKPMPVENAEALLAQPHSEDYWDMRRDLMCRDRRAPISDSEQTALARQAYQIFADNVLELSLLNLSTGEYRVIKRDPRLPGAGSDTEEDFAAYCERMVTN